MNLTGTIESAEHQFMQILEEFFISAYDEKSLPSHGIDHHRRVWINAKEILSTHFSKDNKATSDLVTNLIIASYLHDIGMSVDPGFRHGIHSRDLAAGFLSANNISIHKHSALLEAIENHDKKDYPAAKGISDLLSVLSVADDLDAFGFTGIYRYSEIYLIRNIKPEIMGLMIIENAEKRFIHFRETYEKYPDFFQKHSVRYNTLIRFFREYNKQLPSYQFCLSKPSGYCGVIELFMKMTEEKTSLKNLLNDHNKYQDDIVISGFLNGLKTEL
jgi:hypothetical protein